MGIIDEFVINKQPPTYKHILTGNFILCKGLDDHHRVQSIEDVTGMFVEEAIEFTQVTLHDIKHLARRHA